MPCDSRARLSRASTLTLTHACPHAGTFLAHARVFGTNDKTLGTTNHTYTYSVWFDEKTGIPKGVYNSDDAKGGAVDGGVKHIKDFSTSVDKNEFDLPALCA